MSVNKFKQSLKENKTKPTGKSVPEHGNNSEQVNVNNKIANNNDINNDNNKTTNRANKSVLAEVLDDIPEGQEVKKIVSFSLSPVIIQAIERVSKERKIAKSKLVENILSKVLIEEK